MKTLFNNFIEELKKSVNMTEFNIWLRNITFSHVKGGMFYISTDSNFKKEQIIRKYIAVMQEIFNKMNDKSLTLSITVKNEFLENKRSEKQNEQVKIPKKSFTSEIFDEKPQVDKFSVTISKNFSFDNYVVSGFNKIAHSFAIKVSEHLNRINPFYVYGGVGTGKTHLMHALGNYFLINFPMLKVICINPNDFVGEYTAALKDKRDREFRIKYRSVDILLFDDIQFLSGKSASTIEVFHIFNELYHSGKQMIFCSDRTPEELKNIDERLKSRLSSSVIVEIEKPTLDDKEKILNYYLKENNIILTKEIISFLATYLPPDIRRIIGIVNTLTVHNDICQEDITINYCVKNLKQLLPMENIKAKTPEQIMLSVSNYSKISVKELISAKRTKTIAFYRHVLMYSLREYTNLSFTEIANMIGGKSSSTVINGCNKIVESIKDDKDVDNIVNEIMSR